MPKIIKDGVIAEDNWQVLAKDADSVPAGQVLVPMALYLAQQQQLNARGEEIGVWVDVDEDIESLTAATDISKLPVIAINFPVFMDGTNFSTARLLRDRYGYQGEVRAIGQFIRDQLCYLRRCGVNAFAHQDPEFDLAGALPSLQDFSDGYQASADQPLPLFRRR